MSRPPTPPMRRAVKTKRGLSFIVVFTMLGVVVALTHFTLITAAQTIVQDWANVVWWLGYRALFAAMGGFALGMVASPYLTVRLWRYTRWGAVWRLWLWACVASVIGAAGYWFASAHEWSLPDQAYLLIMLIAVAGAPLIALVLAVGWMRRRVPASWIPFPAHCCQWCGYNRDGLATDAVCPECGTAVLGDRAP